MASDRPAMSEQTDPLAQLAQDLAAVSGCSVAEAADLIRRFLTDDVPPKRETGISPEDTP